MNSFKSMGRIPNQLLLEDNTWSTRYTIPKNTQYSNTSNNLTLINLDFTEEKFTIKLIYHKIDTAHVDMCFSSKTIRQSVY